MVVVVGRREDEEMVVCPVSLRVGYIELAD
jgi:hypothetical protein